MKKYRVWAEINLKTLAQNLVDLKKKVGPKVKILVVVKADAYGHGAIPVARTMLEHGVHMLGVGDSTEAIQLRQAGILAPIIVLGALIEEEIGWIVSYDIIPTIHSMDMLSLLNDEARRQNKVLKVHLKVDTGLTRLGATPARVIEIAKRIGGEPASQQAGLSNLVLDGISTHLSSAALSADRQACLFTSQQIDLFSRVVKEIEQSGLKIPFKHMANTGAIYTQSNSYFNLVRPGGALYGIDPGSLTESNLVKLNPILELKSQITFIKTVPAGTPVGYERTYLTRKRTKIATIPVGYNDGYPYHLSNKGYVLIHGTRIPVVGIVSMDYIMVDVSDVSDVKVSDGVVLIGRQGKERITAEELARLIGASPYVITCGLGKRVRRVYI